MRIGRLAGIDYGTKRVGIAVSDIYQEWTEETIHTIQSIFGKCHANCNLLALETLWIHLLQLGIAQDPWKIDERINSGLWECVTSLRTAGRLPRLTTRMGETDNQIW